MFLDLFNPLLDFARSGGGGSSGGSSGGSGGGIAVLGAIGYVPMSFLGRIFRKNKAVAIGSVILWPTSLLLLVILSLFLKGYGFVIGVGGMLGTGAGLYGWFGKILQKSKRAKQQMSLASMTDPAWNEQSVLDKTRTIFMQYQSDWAQLNADSVRTYTTPRYAEHASLMLEALRLAGRKNEMQNITITEQVVTSMSNPEGTDSDSVTIGFHAHAKDMLIDTIAQKTLYTDESPFMEYWTFNRSGNDWKLDSIAQATYNIQTVSYDLEALARSKGYYYSADWGWLLLPARGQLFGKGKFGVSDINNHIIGRLNDTLIQIYTYVPNPHTDSNGRDYYLIAQMYVPRSYGNIVVRKKRLFAHFRIKGLQKIQTEWTNFNNKYEVYASSYEGATSFELLDPLFMEKLVQLDFEVNIEVVDNVVYLYCKEKKLNTLHYEPMLSVITEAYERMKI